jgi:peptide/nickel transport system ATP-binding protein
MSASLTVESLRVDLGPARILDDVSFAISPGEIVGLVGASGSGKSLTALAIMRLLPRAALMSGKVELDGRPLSEASPAELRRLRGSRIGMVFQEPMTALNPRMRIVDQVAETVILHGADGARAAHDRARRALDAVGLGDAELQTRYPHELSGGQRQRVAIAAATVLSPGVLIADEPTTALDAGTQAGVLKLLAGLARERNVGILLVSHDLAVISSVTDRILVMREGTIVERMATSDLLRGEHHSYTRSLLAAAEFKPREAAPDPDDEDPSRTGAESHDRSRVLSAHGLVREYRPRRRSFGRRPPSVRAVDDV